MKLLNDIKCSNDVKRLPSNLLDDLCSEIRDEIIKDVSATGGHLASNLGTVELTVAIHRVYDTQKDRLVFDVGHQCYSHKIITGRKDQFENLRQMNGLSGFPKPYEAVDDAFIAGHASNSVAVALGMAKARSLNNEDYDVVALIGDGSLTGGLAFEGLANAGNSREPLVIILNDNGMSINKNVGGTARLLSKARVMPEYLEFKAAYRETIGKVKPLYEFNHKIKEAIKKQILPTNLFSDLGFYYLGPIDGHDVNQVAAALKWAKDMRVPVLVHVITKKGKGVEYAENNPAKYHGVGKFNPITGETYGTDDCFSERMGACLCKLAANDSRIVALTAAMTSGTGLDEFSKLYPCRFFDVGIAEGCAVSMSGGLAKQGMIPVFAVYSSFLQRSYDMLIHDIALQNLHAVFCVDRAGIVGNDGETHHGLFDVNYLCSVPNMTVYCPATYVELEQMLYKAICDTDGPVAVRYPRGVEPTETETIKSDLSEQSKITVVSYGTIYKETVKAKEILKNRGIEIDCIKLDCICPITTEYLTSLRKTNNLIVCEEVCDKGCIGYSILKNAIDDGIRIDNFRLLNLGTGIIEQGSYDKLINKYGIDSNAIVETAEGIINGK